MGLGDLYQDSTDTALDHLSRLPPEAPKPARFSLWGTLGAVPRGAAAAVADVGGSMADALKGFGAAAAMSMEADPIARAALGTDRVKAGAAEGRRQIESGEAVNSDLGRSFRNVSRDMRPDPATAHTAEQIVFGAVRPITKLVAGALAGPVGIAAAGAEEGMTQADDLQQQGVDLQTRVKVGAVTGVSTAAAAALPLAGPTLKATAGLYLAGGPGAFMAQQALTSSILDRANYHALAEQFDPLDPVGLALSTLIPLPFAAAGAARNVRAARAARPADPAAAPVAEAPPVPRETIDAAMVHNLTLLRDAQEVAAPLRDVSPAEAIKAQAEAQLADLEARRAELLGSAGELAEPGVIRETRQQLKVHESQKPDASPEAARALAKEIQARDGVSYKTALSKAEKALAERVAEHASVAERMRGIIDRNAQAQRATQEISAIDRQMQQLRDEVEFLSRGREQQAAPAPQADAPPPPPPAPGRLTETTNALEASPDPYVRNVAQGLRAVAGELDRAPQVADSVAAAAREFAALRESGAGLSSVKPGGLAPEVNNLLIGLAENARSAKRVAELVRNLVARVDSLGQPRQASQADAPAASQADLAADAVEGMRALTDAQILDVQPEAARPATEPHLRSVETRLQALEAENPALPVGLDEQGRPVTLADEMARVRREAAEGTDTELGTLDADLLRVAADCALSTGAL